MRSSSPSQSSSSLVDGTEPFQVCATPLFSSVPGDPFGHAFAWLARSHPFQSVQGTWSVPLSRFHIIELVAIAVLLSLR